MIDESLPILTHDRNILVFWEEPKQCGHASRTTGKVMFENTLMMRVSVPGDAKNNVEYWVQVSYPEGYPHPVYGKMRKNDAITQQYGKYIDDYLKRQGGPAEISGTPIEQWPMLTRAQVANLKHNGVYSVEALEGLTDQNIAAIGMDGRKLVQQAKDWLASARNSAAAMQAQERERKTEERFRALEENYSQLAEALSELPPDEQAKVQQSIQKRRGRPPKVAA